MSIFQEYEKLEKEIGYEKYNAINKYLIKNVSNENINKYFKEMSKIDFSLPNYDEKISKLKKKYGIILLADVLYKKNEWQKFENWYNEDYLNRNIKILNIWVNDYDELYCKAILYQNGKKLANINTSFCDTELEYSNDKKDLEMNYELIEQTFKNKIYNNFDYYIRLPKISNYSKILQTIYDIVCESNSNMCHITDEEFKEYYAEDYDKDFEILEKEIEELGLENTIELGGEYKIASYGGLETMFNDDRNLKLDNVIEL